MVISSRSHVTFKILTVSYEDPVSVGGGAPGKGGESPIITRL